MKPPILISPGQIQSLRSLLKSVTGNDTAALYIASRLVERDLEDLSQITLDEWVSIRNTICPFYAEDDWVLGV